MKKVKAIRQRDITDCGAACIASILDYYGTFITVSQIRQYAGTDQQGTSLRGLKEAAEAFGLSARAVRANKDNLPLVQLPAIAHLVLNSGLQHYVVIYRLRRSGVEYMDPANGKTVSECLDLFLSKWSGVIVMFAPQPGFTPKNRTLSVSSRFMELVRPHYPDMLQALLGAIVYTVLGFATSIYIQKLIDDVIGNSSLELLHLMSTVMIILIIIQVVIGLCRSLIGLKIGQALDARLVTGYYKHLFRLPVRFFDTMRVGEILSRVGDAIKIRVFINELALSLMVSVLIVSFTVVLMFLYYWKLALIVMAVLPVYLLLYHIAAKTNRKWQRSIMERSAELESCLVEGLHNASTVKRLNLGDYVVERTEDSFFRLINTGYKSGLYNLFIGTSSEFVNRLLIIVILWIGAWFVMKQELSAGELLSFYSLIGYFTGPVATLIGSGRMIQDATIAAERLFEVIDLDAEQIAGVPLLELSSPMGGDIVFSNVCFSYGPRNMIFNNLGFRIRKSSITAVVGESGCGKSTIISLLLNLYPLKEGKIFIGDFDITYYSHNSLRNYIGVVPQQIDLFNGTIIENIAIGDPAPDLERIIQLCRSTGADQFIEKMADSYYSKIGEKGTNLSGGQKQRIGITRALYRKPEILILDESTANLDSLSESRINQLLQELKNSGTTIIMITHRLRNIINADIVHLIENGMVRESGSHQELIEMGGAYYRYWSNNSE